MGLAVVHGIVKNHGGFIRVVSAPGKGSSFSVLFPERKDAPADEQLADRPIPTGSEHVLYVDDEEFIVNMGAKLLERLGYSLTTLTSSLEALELIKTHPDMFDLLITDQTMPEMTGADLARQILNLYPDMPIILCTGYSDSISREKPLAIGIRNFMFKPILKKDLAPIIRNILDS